MLDDRDIAAFMELYEARKIRSNWSVEKLIRKLGTCPDLIRAAEEFEAKLLKRDKNSLLWLAAKNLRSADQEKIQHIEELKEVVNVSKHFKKGQ